jgi:ATP-dependent Clp protease ATP-binding subunit ClpC
MFERFTDRARKVLQLANEEVRRFQHEYIGTEHILLGILKEGRSAAIAVLKKLGVEPDNIMLETEKHIVAGFFPVGLTYRLRPTPLMKKVIVYAMEEAREGGFNYIGVEHILLGLLREDEGVASQVLMHLGVSLDKVREEFQWSVKQSQSSKNEETNEPSFDSLNPLVEDRPHSGDKPPEACPECGDPHLIRILWNRVHLSAVDQDDVDAGRAILCYYSKLRKKPAWVCLFCSPQWIAIPRLSRQVYESQLDKENAVASEDYESAIKHRDALRDLKQHLSQIVEDLLKDQ